MRIRRSLRIPEIPHPAPFALAPSHTDDSLCIYTTQGSHQLKVGSLLMIGIAIFALAVTLQGTLTTTGGVGRYGAFPAWVLYPLGIAVLITGIKLLRDATSRSQIIIDRRSHKAQIQYPKGPPSTTDQATITLTTSHLRTGQLLSDRSTNRTIAQGVFHLVAIDVNHDCFVLGAFRSTDAADRFASQAQTHTNLPLSSEHSAELKRVAGERMLLFRSTDKHALNHQKRAKPAQPIRFLTETDQ